MDAELVLDTKGQSKGGVHQLFTSSSSGSYFCALKDVPEKGIYYTYQVGADHSFRITLYQGSRLLSNLEFRIKNSKVSYLLNNQQRVISFGKTGHVVQNLESGLRLKIAFERGVPNRIIVSLTGHSETDLKLGYIGD